MMAHKDPYLPRRKRFKGDPLPDDFSEEELARDWTLTPLDQQHVERYRKKYRLWIALQLGALRLYGRFIANPATLSPRLISYLNAQLNFEPSLTIEFPTREATFLQQQKEIFAYLHFRKYGEFEKKQLLVWLATQVTEGLVPTELIARAEQYLIEEKIALPGEVILRRQVISLYTQQHSHKFTTLFHQLSQPLQEALDALLEIPSDAFHSFFATLKEYPPYANATIINDYLMRYHRLNMINLSELDFTCLSIKMIEYFYRLTRRYHADDIKRFAKPKRYTLLVCFLIETRKILLDYIIALHDQLMTDVLRRSRNGYEKEFQEYRKRFKQANDTLLKAVDFILDHDKNALFNLADLFQTINENKLKQSIEDCYVYKRLEERGMPDKVMARYTYLRSYFSAFIQLPWVSDQSNSLLIKAIQLLRQLDSGAIKKLPKDTPYHFIAGKFQTALFDENKSFNRALWEMGVAIALRDALRSGDLYLTESKQHVSFWGLLYGEVAWNNNKAHAYRELNLPTPKEALSALKNKFSASLRTATQQFEWDDFARIENSTLRLRKDDKLDIPNGIKTIQKVIDSSLPKIRIEQLLMEVDKITGFSQCFTPLADHKTRPPAFYKSLMASLIAMATNLGVVTMANSTAGISVSQLRHIMDYYIREETIKAANARIVNKHHQLPFSQYYGKGDISSSDAQRFGITASSLLSAFYPRYFGYYEKAVGIYTHVSDQYSVFSTRVISCNVREAIYVLDGLLENNTLLRPVEHTTDTAGYTEHIFALCHLLGFYFMPRIRDLKDQQLYKLDRQEPLGPFNDLIRHTVDLALIEEQWDAMVRVAASLKQRTTPAHVVVSRLAKSTDRLSKAFTALGRIIKTEYILRYLTDQELRRRVQIQLNRGEYRHKLPRWIFFANQGEFQIGDYEEIMHKASCLSLVSNAILYWNTPKIGEIIHTLRQKGEKIEDATIARISLLPYKHVIPNGAYFVGME